MIPQTLSSDNIRLDACLPEHVGVDYVNWLNDPQITEFTEVSDTVHSIESVKEYVQKQNQSSSACLWRILFDGRHVGNIRASNLGSIHQRAVLAIIIGDKAMQGKSIGSTAINLATAHLFENGYRKVTAGMYAVNEASRRAFLKSGFEVEAVLKNHFLHNGLGVDGLLLACHKAS